MQLAGPSYHSSSLTSIFAPKGSVRRFFEAVQTYASRPKRS